MGKHEILTPVQSLRFVFSRNVKCQNVRFNQHEVRHKSSGQPILFDNEIKEEKKLISKKYDC